MGFIREDELISRKLKTCENCEWCIPIIEKNKKFEIEVPHCLLKAKQTGLFDIVSFSKREQECT